MSALSSVMTVIFALFFVPSTKTNMHYFKDLPASHHVLESTCHDSQAASWYGFLLGTGVGSSSTMFFLGFHSSPAFAI